MMPRRRRAPLIAKFPCEYCGHDVVSIVLDTRGPRRRRQCVECGHTFPTLEVLAPRKTTPMHYGRRPQPSLFDEG